MTARQLIVDALLELGVGGPGETLPDEEADIALGRLNSLIDAWNAERQAIYAEQLLSFTLTPSLQPHTIGPTGTWTTSQRPVSIEGLTVCLSSGVTLALCPRDLAWYQGVPAPTLTSGEPTDFAYNPTWPNGEVYLWPIPSLAYAVTALVRTVLGPYTLATTFTLPPGYRRALTLTLAEECQAPFAVTAKPTTVMNATKARSVIFSNNTVIPPLVTQCAGMPGGRGGWFDYQTGMVR